jgi:DNA-directed RNA polymerase subunit alpha
MREIKFNVRTEEKKDNYGRFVISPLERGYGSTLGNSLRRVLLSSLQGAAATKVKIKGVQHRFSTLKGLKEDVLELLLNIKETKFRLDNNTKKASVKLTKKGPGEVKAGDLEVPAGVEVINKEHVLAILADKKSKLELEIEVKKGYGYSPFEDRKLEQIGVLPIDAVFSPVQRANYRVEETRVGRITNLDKLILEVWTNGTLDPKTALNLASDILVRYFSLITGGRPASTKTKDSDEKKVSIEELKLSARVKNALSKEGITTIEELTKMTKADLKKVKNMGQKSVQLIKEVLKTRGLSLKK